jgi:ribosomal protein S18 acetylase RimI-like enzyme
MCQGKWLVKKALKEDAGRWFVLASSVKEDFQGLDLSIDEDYRSGMMKNIMRGTAIYIEDELNEGCPIIGAMTFSPNQNHISWLAVHPNYRNKGVATSLMQYMLNELKNAEQISVKTFSCDDKYGKAARSFYRKHEFSEGEIFDDDDYPHPVQVFTKVINRE